jgi:HEAT repeat protein
MTRQVLQPFEEYQKARITFVQDIAELAKKQSCIEGLSSAGVMFLLKPLLSDTVSSIQQSAALAIGRLANYSIELAESCIKNDILPQLLNHLSVQNRLYKKAACYVLRAVSKHNALLATAVVQTSALKDLVNCLEEFDPSVKESAAWALGYIAKHNTELAFQVVEAKAVHSLILCLQEPEVELKRAAAMTLSFICQHTKQLAQQVAEIGLDQISFFVTFNDTVVKRNICLLLGNIVKHSVELADHVMDKLNPRKLLGCLNETDPIIAKNAAFCLCEIARKSFENSRKIVNNNGAAIIVEFITNVKGDVRLYGIMTLGFIASYKENLATEIIKARAINQLKDALQNETQQHIKAAACYALGQIGMHSSEHAKEVSDANVLYLMLFYYRAHESTDELKMQAKVALKNIIDKCSYLTALEPLIQKAPDEILKHILDQYIKHLKNSTFEKKQFIQNEGLKKLQEIYHELPDQLKEKVHSINSYFPDSIVKYYSPEYAQALRGAMINA